MCEAQEEHSGSERLPSSAIDSCELTVTTIPVFSSGKFRNFQRTPSLASGHGRSLSAEALKAELKALLKMR
jgi:hypothetical protein